MTTQDQQSRAELPSGIAAASILRAMAMNYRAGHTWDSLDERACTNAANEIDRLKAELDAARALPAPSSVSNAGGSIPQGMESVAVMVLDASGTKTIDASIGFFHDTPLGTEFYTAAQVQAMLAQADMGIPISAPLPPGWQAAPVEPTEDQLAAVRQKPHPTSPDRWDGNNRRIYREMLAAAPRPPAAQDELEIEQTRREAESLAWSIFNRHYAQGEDYTSGRSVFGLCDSLRGVLSQIDNMTAGLVRDTAAHEVSREVLDAIRAAGMQLLKGAAGFTLEKAGKGIAQPAALTTCGAADAMPQALPAMYGAQAPTAGAGSVTAGAAPAYRLLQRGENICQGDEFIDDDTVTWHPIKKGFCGYPWGGAWQPMRRAINAAPEIK